MLKRLVFLVLCTAIIGVSTTGAQQPPATPLPAAAPPAPATTQPAPAPSQAAPTPVPAPAPARVFGQPVSIRIDLTVSDQVGAAAPARKTMTLIAADGERASIRASNRSPREGGAIFNVDVKPMLVQEKIRLDLSVMFDAPNIGQPDNAKEPLWTTSLQESMGVIVDNGKPMVVSQSADPRTDRKVTVEVKATVVK